MGSYYMKCGVTNTTITDNDTCYGFLLLSKEKNNNKNIYINDGYDILPIVIKGTYADYGEINIEKDYLTYLDNALGWFNTYFKILDRQGEEVVSDMIEDRGGSHTFNDLLRASERDESYRVIKRNGYSSDRPMKVEMLLVSGRFIDTLLGSYRENPYLYKDFDNKKATYKIDKDCLSFEECLLKYWSDRYYSDLNFLVNRDFKEQSNISSFLERYLHNTNTAILPSDYGSQEVDLGGLQIMRDFYTEELKAKSKDIDDDMEDEEEWDSKRILHNNFGGTYCGGKNWVYY